MNPMIDVTLAVKLSGADKGAKLSLYRDKVVGVIELPNIGTIIIAMGGTTVPVMESKDTVLSMLNNETA